MSILLVTVNCLDHSVDLGLPADLPVRSYLPTLLEACGLAQPEVSDPNEWELSLVGGGIIRMTDTLEGCGVLDGANLALRVAAATDAEASKRAAIAYVPAYLSVEADPGGPVVNWVRDNLFNE